MFDTELWLKKSRAHKCKFFKRFPQDCGFAIDGPNDVGEWEKAKPKIVFVLKETYGGTNEEFMCMNSEKYNNSAFRDNKTNRYFSRLAAGIMDLWNGYEAKRSTRYTRNELYQAYKAISTIELKKSTNKRSTICSEKELKDREFFSKAFIKWQIEYLDPDIVFCCGKKVEDLVRNHILGSNMGARIFSSYRPSAPGYKVDDNVKRVSEKFKVM